MPAYTVKQLEDLLGSYTDPNVPFLKSLAQVLPRVYNMGPWRDTVGTESRTVYGGYVTFPPNVEAVLQATVDGYPVRIRGQWTDRRVTGITTTDPRFGMVDDGLHPVYLDTPAVQDITSMDDYTPCSELLLHPEGSATPVVLDGFDGIVRLSYRDNADVPRGHMVVGPDDDGSGNAAIAADAGTGFATIDVISYEDIPYPVDLVDPAFADRPYVTIPAGSGLLRCRRYRMYEDAEEVVAQVKYGCPDTLTMESVVPLGNLNALKHALLARIAEDSADPERSRFHWGECRGLLEEEMNTHRGGAAPNITLDVWGGQSPVRNLY